MLIKVLKERGGTVLIKVLGERGCAVPIKNIRTKRGCSAHNNMR
jgi:hypothetical protein